MYLKMRKAEYWSENDSICEQVQLSSCNRLCMRAAENVEMLSKKGKGRIILTPPTPLAHKIAKKMQ